MARNPRTNTIRCHGWTAVLALLLTAAACGPAEEIRVYTAPKDPAPNMSRASSGSGMSSVPAGASGARILAVTVQEGEDIWFFKLTGEADKVEPVIGEAEAFLATVQFVDEAPGVTFDAPDNWNALAPGQFATAKWALDDAAELVFSITSLSFPNWDDQIYLANVNRWRGQVGLPRTNVADMNRMARSIEVGGLPASRLDMGGVGAPAGSGAQNADPHAGMGRDPHAGMGRDPHAGLGIDPTTGGVKGDDGTPAGSEPAKRELPLKWELPEGWTELPAGGFRVASFQIEGDTPLSVAITRFPGDVGGLHANVNRWLGQVGLGPVSPDEVDSVAEKLDVGDLEVRIVDAKGEQQRLLAALVPGDAETWFVKVSGAPDAIESAVESFRRFVESLRLEKG